MRLNKIKFASPLLIPVAITPVFASSCSVYTDLMKDYTPTYEQLSGSITLEQAIDKWVDKASTTSNFIRDELFWSSAQSAKEKYSKPFIEDYPEYYYKGEYTVCSYNLSYANVTNKDQKRVSYKTTCEIEEKNSYYHNEEYIGYGTIHYSVEWEAKNLVMDVCKYYHQGLKKDFWLVKPELYDIEHGWWKDYLKGDEGISFNVRCIYEVYDDKGIQKYGYEATEAAVMDKEISYTVRLGDILNYFCCFGSYYLDPCKTI